MELLLPLALVCGPVALLIGWEINKKQRSGMGWQQHLQHQAQEKQVQRVREQMLIGEVDGLTLREAEQRARQQDQERRHDRA